MKILQSISRWLYPLFLGIVTFNCLRLATDLLKDKSFWVGSLTQHIISQVSMIILCYALDILWRKLLEKRRKNTNGKKSSTKEYIIVLLTSFITLNLFALLGEHLGVFYMGNGIIDYVVQTVVCLPLFLLYYVMIRNEIISKDLQQQSLLLEQIKSKQLETELDYLKAQYHPHFLFNALNTVYFQINLDKAAARRTIELLSELLRYQLYEINKIVTIAEEIDFIQTYIQFQRLRMSESLKLAITIDETLKEQRIHPLLFQPLLENAFKYVGGKYDINIDIRKSKSGISFIVNNSLPEETIPPKKEKGIGIENLKRRLELLYPDKHTLRIKEEDNRFYAMLIIKTNEDEH